MLNKYFSLFILTGLFSVVCWAFIASIVFLTQVHITNLMAYPLIAGWFLLLMVIWLCLSHQILTQVRES